MTSEHKKTGHRGEESLQSLWYVLVGRARAPHANLSKALCYTRSGDLSRAPSDLPGSPNYSLPSDPVAEVRRRARVRAFKVAGVFVGDPDACSDELVSLLRAKLRPLALVSRLTDTEHVAHSLLLALALAPPRCVCHPDLLDAHDAA